MMQTVLLAAGSSNRMGEPKLLLPYRGGPLILQALNAALMASDSVILVTGYNADLIVASIAHLQEKHRDRLVVVHNPSPQDGQFSSTLFGMQSVDPDADFAIAVADLPLVCASHYKRLYRMLPGYEAVRPYYKNTPGHPVICAASLRETILALPVGATMRELLAGRKVLEYEDGDAAWTTDIDTPQAYEKLISQ
jgi:molybdenum cofactor cytidylyltransferase